jgi:hypothetical protein
MKDYPEKKSSHSDTMGVIFPYFWFSDVFLPLYLTIMLFENLLTWENFVNFLKIFFIISRFS